MLNKVKLYEYDCVTLKILKSYDTLRAAANDISESVFKNKKNKDTIANSIVYHMVRKQQYCGRCFAYQKDFANVKKEIAKRLKISVKLDNRKKKYLTIQHMYREYKRLTKLIYCDIPNFSQFRQCLIDYFDTKFKNAVLTDGIYVADKYKIGAIKLYMDGTILNSNKYKFDKIYKRLIPKYLRKECVARYKHCYSLYVPKGLLVKYRDAYSQNASILQKKTFHDR